MRGIARVSRCLRFAIPLLALTLSLSLRPGAKEATSAAGAVTDYFTQQTVNAIKSLKLFNWFEDGLPPAIINEIRGMWEKVITPVIEPLAGVKPVVTVETGFDPDNKPYILFKVAGASERKVTMMAGGKLRQVVPARSVSVSIYYNSVAELADTFGRNFEIPTGQDAVRAKEVFGTVSRAVSFAGERGVMKVTVDPRSKSKAESIFWQAGEVFVSVSGAAENGQDTGVQALASSVDAALKQAGVYDFPRSWFVSAQPAQATPGDVFDGNRTVLGTDDIALLEPGELTKLDPAHKRQGAAADGVSRLLVIATFPSSGDFKVSVEGGAKDGTAEAVFFDSTEEVDGKHYAFAFYTPPQSFGPGSGNQKPENLLAGEVEYRDIVVNFSLTPEGGGAAVTARQALKLARPPLVLVHGTFDNPDDCWKTGSIKGPAFFETMARVGIKTFPVDYHNSNGKAAGTWLGPGTRFEDNKNVVWANDGIQAALAYYRDTLKLAATQADVVGHSMGGLLARVYASTNYNPQYARAENFSRGDIHRLITIGTPHHGSDLPNILKALGDVTVADVSLSEYFAAKKFVYGADWLKGLRVAGAIADQLPGSPALLKIGPTAIPSHAIVGVTEVFEEGNPDKRGIYDYGVDEQKQYRDSFVRTCGVFFYNPGLLENILKKLGLEQNTEMLLEQIEATNFIRERERGWLGAGTAAGDYGVEEDPVLLELFRAAMFGNTPNDCTVREESQAGDLKAEGAVTVLSDVLHSFEPRYASVQHTVVGLLKNDGPFDPQGFPAAGKPQLANRPPDDDLESHLVTGDEAIARSGIVPSHARNFATLMKSRKDVVVLFRPVNKDATALIERGAATKGMPIKGKSANWGPQKGYLPAEQRYSKLWRSKKTPAERDQDIKDYNEKVKQSVDVDKVAELRDLFIEFGEPGQGGPRYDVFCLKTEHRGENAETEVFLRDQAGQFFDWRTDGSDFSYDKTPSKPVAVDPGRIDPFVVLADPVSKRFFTADYDLLAVGFHPSRGPPSDLPAEPDPETGFINEEQKQLLVELNAAAKAAGYDGGNICHHGPENQYPASPGNEYPVTIFEPSGRIVSVSEGPKGYSDLHLKRYFARKKRAKWYLEPNTVSKGWRWEYWRDYDPIKGYDDRDADPDDKENMKRR